MEVELGLGHGLEQASVGRPALGHALPREPSLRRDTHPPMLRFRRLARRTAALDDRAHRRTPHDTTRRRTALARIAETARGGGLAIGWLIAAALIALGAAGVVAGMDAPAPNGVDRTGRTGHGDALVDASLDTIESEMRTLSASVATLGEQARVILASLPNNDADADRHRDGDGHAARG